MSFARASAFLRSQPGFSDTADLYRLPKAGRYVRFLRLFGFDVSGSGPAMTVRRAATAGPSGARRGRPEGAVDIAPRAPRRGLPAATALLWTPDNPYRGGTAAHARFELYRTAASVGEARELGATPQDIKGGIEKAYGQLQ